MAKRIEGTIESIGSAKRQFRSSKATLRDVRISHDGTTEVWPEVETEMDVLNILRTPARGWLYLSDVKGAPLTLFGFRLEGLAPTFHGGNELGERYMVWFWMLISIAFCWTGIGLFFVWVLRKDLKVFADAERARTIYMADGKEASSKGTGLKQPLPWYYFVNDRPVKMVAIPGGGMDVLALDMGTGEFKRDLHMLSKVQDPFADVDAPDEMAFERRVAAIRDGLATKQ